MKRNILLNILMALLILVMIGGIVYLSDPERFASQDAGQNEGTAAVNYIQYFVCSGEISHTYECSGRVISDMPEVYIDEITVEDVNDDNFICTLSKGESVDSGSVLYSYKGKDVLSENDVKVLDISYSINDNIRSVAMKLLDYDKLYIVAQIDADLAGVITYDTPVTVNINGNDYETGIKEIGYEISNGKIDIEVILPVNALPGSDVDLLFVTDTVSAGMYIPADALLIEDDRYFLNIQKDDKLKEIEKTEIRIGQYFTLDDGEYVEILSGVNEGDIALIEYYVAGGESGE